MNDLAQIGHNRPDHVAGARNEMREILAPFAQRRDELLASAAKAVVRSRAEAGDAADLVGISQQVWDRIDTKRREVSDGHFQAHKAAIEAAESFWSDVAEAMDGVLAKIDTYKAERQRLADEQAKEQAALMAPPLPPPPPPSSPRANVDYTTPVQTPIAPAPRPVKAKPIKGDMGFKAADQTETIVEITDWRQLPDHVIEAEAVQEAMRKVITGLVRVTKQKSMPGAKISFAGKSSIRR